MQSTPAPLGYIGLGRMGSAIAAALSKRYPLLVSDHSGAAELRLLTVTGPLPVEVATPATIAAQCQIIMLCLPSIHEVELMLAPEGPLLPYAVPGTIFVDQSTSDPLRFGALARQMARRGFTLVDAPVSGGPQAVAARSLLVTLGAAPDIFTRLAAIFTAVTDIVLHTGPAGSAMTIKVANNYLAALQATAALEVLALAIAQGCDPAVTVRTLTQGSGGNYYVQRFLDSHILQARDDQTATIAVMRKDVALAAALAQNCGQQLAGLEDLQTRIDSCIADYGADASYHAIARSVSDRSGQSLGLTRGASLSPRQLTDS